MTKGPREMTDKIEADLLPRFALWLFCGFFIFLALISLTWTIYHDAAIHMYFSYGMHKFGYVPYRDFFNMNMPGTFFIYYLIGWVTGYTDLGFRVFDLLWLGGIMYIGYRWMRGFGSRPALAGPVLFGSIYLGLGCYNSMEKDVIALLPIAAAVSMASPDQEHRWRRHFISGLLLGLSATVKIHIAVGIIAIAAMELIGPSRGKREPRFAYLITAALLPLALGFAIPLGIMFLYLWVQGNLHDFLEIALNYWPLYGHLTAEHRTIAGIDRLQYLLAGLRGMSGYALWLGPCALGIYLALLHFDRGSRQRWQAMLLCLLTFCYGLYPGFSGQFWSYHYLPFAFFATQAGSLCLMEPPFSERKSLRIFPVLVLLIAAAMTLKPPLLLYEQIQKRSLRPQMETSYQIAEYLKNHLKPGDKVQPLAWALGGATSAMRMAGAPLATRFVSDNQFFHHISSSYIQGLRKEFMQKLEQVRPRFIVMTLGDLHEQPQGPDTTTKFEELHTFIADNYKEAEKSEGYIIYEIIEQDHK